MSTACFIIATMGGTMNIEWRMMTIRKNATDEIC